MVCVGSRRAATAAVVLAASFAAADTAEARRVVYLNAEPTALVDTNGQDPTTNSYATGGFTPGMISGWPALTDQEKALLTFYMKEATAPFDIVFTWDRPAAGSYDMLVMGTATDAETLFEGLGCSGAVGLRDCEDAQDENISFLFHGCLPEEQQADLRRVAFTSLTGLGFGWGLENLAVSGQIMGSFNANALEFGNECSAISGTGQCFHEGGCPTGQQNSTADLVTYIGARVDDGPPLVEITSPAHMDVVSSEFAVEADVEDLFGGLEVTLEIVEADQMLSDLEPPYRWNLSAVPEGAWTLRVHVVDADGNEESDEVVVCVGTGDCDPGQSSGDDQSGTDGETGDGDGTGSGASDGETSGGGGGIDPTLPSSGSGGASPAGSACHCRSDDPSGGAEAALALAVLALLRRRCRSSNARRAPGAAPTPGE